MHMSEDRRRQLIERAIRDNPVQSQAALAETLQEHGVETTQATVSRDLAAMGVLRGPNGYVIPDGAGLPVESSADTAVDSIRRHVLSARPADALVVLRTAPGHANLVAVELDRWPPKGVVGCIAGDDTIFLATTSQSAARRVAREILDTLT